MLKTAYLLPVVAVFVLGAAKSPCASAPQDVAITASSPPALPGDLSPTGVVQLPGGLIKQLHSAGGRFPTIEASAGAITQVVLRLPPAVASQLIIESLDGAAVSLQAPAGTDGIATLQIGLGMQPGIYRVLVKLGQFSTILQFRVPSDTAILPAGGAQ